MEENFDAQDWVSKKWKDFRGDYSNIKELDDTLDAKKILAIANVLANSKVQLDTLKQDSSQEPKIYNLMEWIPEGTEKFWIKEIGVKLLSEYGIKAEFTPAYENNGYGSNDRIDLHSTTGDSIRYLDIDLNPLSSSTISLTSNHKNLPLYSNVIIEEGEKNGKTMLYLQYWDRPNLFQKWIPKIQ